MPDLWSLFGQMWTYEFMVRGIAVTVLTGVVCAVISCWLVMIGWSLMGDALSHAVLPGVVIAYLLDIPFSVGATVTALIVVGLIFMVRHTSRIKPDVSMGVVFTMFFAFGLVLVSKNPSNIDLNHVLFGDLLGITNLDMYQVLVLAPLALVILLLRRRDLTAYTFDPIHLEAIGISSRRVGATLLVCLVLTVVTAMQAVGAILIVTLLITPGATALLLTERFTRMLMIAPVLSAFTSLTGIYLSYWFDTASGATVVAVGGAVFFLVWLVSPRGLRGFLDAYRKDEPCEVSQ